MTDAEQGQAQQPGWYPEPGTGRMRWWDGTQWGAYQDQAAGAAAPVVQSSGDPKQTAALAHYLGAIISALTCGGGWIGPLIMYLTQKDKDKFVEYNSAEALNFQLTMLIGFIIGWVTSIVLIGFIILPIVWLASIIIGIMGGMAASKGEWYKAPLTIKFVKVAM